MNQIQLNRPELAPDRVGFSWSGGGGGLYHRQSFHVDLKGAGTLPERLWLMLCMMCLHMHWVLLRPCRIVLPHKLLPGEREIWTRLMTIGFQTLEAHKESPENDLNVDIVEGERDLPAPVPMAPSERCATCFSGGRDSLTQTGLLLELSRNPLLVATTSPMPPLKDQLTPRRAEVFRAMASRDDLEFVEVKTDIRSCWDNMYSINRGYPSAVNEISDTLVYTAMTVAASWLRGCANVFLAAENEVSDNVRRDGHIILFHHFMYSVPVQHGLSLLLRPWGMYHGSLTCPLRGPHVQALLTRRYPDLARYQYSCWKMSGDEPACSSCSKCLLAGLGSLLNGGNPGHMGIDLLKLNEFATVYQPRFADAGDVGWLPRDLVTHEHQMNIMRFIRDVPYTSMLRCRPDLLLRPRGWRSLWKLSRAKKRARRFPIGPPAGWRPAYCEFIAEPLRARVRAIYEGMFNAEPLEAYREQVSGNRELVAFLDGAHGHER